MAREKKSDRAKKIAAKMGYTFVGMVTGTHSYRSNTNLSKFLVSKNLTPDDVCVMTGARAGRYMNDGYELLVFLKKEDKVCL